MLTRDDHPLYGTKHPILLSFNDTITRLVMTDILIMNIVRTIGTEDGVVKEVESVTVIKGYPSFLNR